MYIAINWPIAIAKEETRSTLAAVLANHYKDRITLEDNGESISWYINGKKQPQGWVSQQRDERNGYSLDEAKPEAYEYYLDRIKRKYGLEIYSVQ